MLIFILAISCWTTSNLPWFMDLTFQVPMHYCSLHHWTLLSPPATSTTKYCFYFGPAASFFLLVITVQSSPIAYWIPSDLGTHHLMSYLLAFSYYPWYSQGKNTGVVCLFLLQWTMFCLNSSLWLICLGCPCTAWLIASLSYTSLFTTRLWSMKGGCL